MREIRQLIRNLNPPWLLDYFLRKDLSHLPNHMLKDFGNSASYGLPHTL